MQQKKPPPWVTDPEIRARGAAKSAITRRARLEERKREGFKTIERVARDVCLEHGIALIEILAMAEDGRRDRELVACRRAIFIKLVRETTVTYSDICLYFGCHIATVISIAKGERAKAREAMKGEGNAD